MSKAEALHALYETCKDINLEEASELVVEISDSDEKDFIRKVMDYILQQKQKKAIAEMRF